MVTDEGIWIPGMGDITPEVMEALTSQQVARQYVAREEMQDMAAAGRERFHLPTGEVKMMIHPVSYHYWGQRLGYECWEDKEFCEEYLRDNDYARVTSRARNATVGWRASVQGEAAAANYARKRKMIFTTA